MLSRLDDPHYCLTRAREVRRNAEAAREGNARATLLALANDYLSLAKFAIDRRKTARALLAAH